VGPYEQLGETWGRLMGQWLPHSGERGKSSDSYEIYLNNPTEVPKHDLRTELYVPLE
jgi:AraC family transcriptional regulator